VSEPIVPELLPAVEPVPAEDPVVLPVLGEGEVVVPPLVEPVWAKAAPAASMEMNANRFHHVFMRSALRLREDARRPP